MSTTLLPRLSPESFRRMLAGLADDTSEPGWLEDFREAGARLALIMARFYDRTKLEPIKLWERIGSGIAAACEQVDDGDLDRLISICLDHVCASHSAVAADQEFAPVIQTLSERDESWRLQLVRYLKTHSYTILIHGRKLWEERKEVRLEANA